MAYEWGLRHSAMPVVLIGELPEHVFRELEVSRRIIIQPVPGAGPQSLPVIMIAAVDPRTHRV